MGEVWRAKDTRLDRDVAIKLLPAEFAANAQLHARFNREAKAISALNHPHICTLYDIGREDERDFLVMEMLEGESLADRLRRGPLPPHEVIRYGVQIARALDAAHRQGIIHRDLKPGNVMLTKGGAKLLDFGLAKTAAEGPAPIEGLTTLPTEHKPLTEEGTILGTFQYMAPEQLEGHEADARTDIFAFGALLYEMATGRRAFQGQSKTSLIAAIVSAHPEPISQVVPMTPPALDHVVRRCLEKDPDDRWQSARDIAGELEWISEAGSRAGVASPITIRRKTRERLAWGMAAAASVAAILAIVMNIMRAEPDARTIRSNIIPEAGTSFDLAAEAAGTATISPDGRWVTFRARDENGVRQLWLRSLDGQQVHPIAGTENARYPFWSPDSRFIAFFTEQSLMKVDIQGGPPLSLAPIGVNPRKGSWNENDVILYSPSSLESLHRVSANGGEVTRVTTLDSKRGETTHRWATFLPGGRYFVYMAGTHTAGTRSDINALFLGDLEDPTVKKLLIQVRSNAEYADGNLLYVRDGVLIAHPFDLESLALHGTPVPVAEGVQSSTGFFHGVFSASRNGTLLYRIAEESEDTKIERIDASGKIVASLGAPKAYLGADLAPDGRRLAAGINDPQQGTGDIWILDLARNVSTRFTFDASDEQGPIWSSDGTRILFARMHEGTYSIFERPASGEGNETLVAKNSLHLFPVDITADGRYLVIVSYDPAANLSADIQLLDRESDSPQPFLVSSFDEFAERLSPDGKWLAYTSNESGRNELYVTAFPDGGSKWQISSEGVQPSGAFWSRDGSALYYMAEGGEKKRIEVSARGSSLEIGAPESLFQASDIVAWVHDPANGTFLAFRGEKKSLEAPLTLVTNWTSVLRKGSE